MWIATLNIKKERDEERTMKRRRNLKENLLGDAEKQMLNMRREQELSLTITKMPNTENVVEEEGDASKSLC